MGASLLALVKSIYYMESIILTPEPLIITIDFNIHVNNTNDSNDCEFLDWLASLGLKQHFIGPAPEGGHTLDLVITREYDPGIKSALMIDRFIRTMPQYYVNLIR